MVRPAGVPTLSDVCELILPQIAAKWQNLAIVLGVKNFLIEAVSVNHPGDCEGACQSMLDRWLRGEQHTGEEKRTWTTLLTALGQAGFVELERNLRRENFDKT